MAKNINFIPNDPGALKDMPLRAQAPRKMPAAGRATFRLPSPAPAQQPAAPGTAAFVFWQCREAVLAAMEMWQKVEGPVTKWARSSSPKSLDLSVDGGEDLNAYYDGNGLRFFHYPAGSNVTFSGASTEVVSHECGHALLDTIRPDLWGINYTEVAAFHEAFGDCVAMLTALDDKPTRVKLLSITKDLSKPSFFEALMEDLAAGVKKNYGASNPSAEPRHALNTFQWDLPENLPARAPPKKLCSEIHSFGRVFVGCFYDLLRLVFAGQASSTEGNLWKAAVITAKLLIEGTRNAPVDPRFFRSVGRAMLLADDAQSSGKLKPLIAKAFSQHGIALGSPTAPSPTAALAGAAPRRRGKAMVVAPATVRGVRALIDGSSNRPISTRAVAFAHGHGSELVYPHRVSLDSLGLRGVVAVGHVSTLVSEQRGRAALVGNPLPTTVADAEVLTFVGTLMEYNRIDLGGAPGPAAKRAIAAAPARRAQKGHLPTHKVVNRGNEKLLERVRFACGCCDGRRLDGGKALPDQEGIAF